MFVARFSLDVVCNPTRIMYYCNNSTQTSGSGLPETQYHGKPIPANQSPWQALWWLKNDPTVVRNTTRSEGLYIPGTWYQTRRCMTRSIRLSKITLRMFSTSKHHGDLLSFSRVTRQPVPLLKNDQSKRCNLPCQICCTKGPQQNRLPFHRLFT